MGVLKFRSMVLAGIVAGAMVVFAGASAFAGEPYPNPEDAQQQGISAYKGGYYELAIPALEYAADKKMLLAQFYLGQLYADNDGRHTNHPRAYRLFQTIAENHLDTDPGDQSTAPYVSRALTALARYVERGMPEIALRPDPLRAAEFLRHAANFFDDDDAQFELAKLNLSGEIMSGEGICGINGVGISSDVARGRHWLVTLAEKRHAAAQAFLADLYWRGLKRGTCLVIPKDPVKALLLISVAVKNAPSRYRVWIEDVYQNIYCGASKGVRKQVGSGLVAQWDKRFGRKPALELSQGLGPLNPSLLRVCKDGRTPPLLRQSTPDREIDQGEVASDGSSATASTGNRRASRSGSGGALSSGGRAHGFVRGSALGGGGGQLRNVGEQGDLPADW